MLRKGWAAEGEDKDEGADEEAAQVAAEYSGSYLKLWQRIKDEAVAAQQCVNNESRKQDEEEEEEKRRGRAAEAVEELVPHIYVEDIEVIFLKYLRNL